MYDGLDDACVYFPTGVCPVVPDIHFKDSQTFLDPSFTKGKQNHSSHTGILIQDLIGLCSQAPFGRDEKMVVDKTGHADRWILRSSQFATLPHGTKHLKS